MAALSVIGSSEVPREDEFSSGPYDLSAPPEWNAFPGLYPPLYTQTPDVFFDWVAPFLPEIELRVLLYLIRRTLGFKKQGDQITVEQICSGIITREGARLDWGAQLGERSVQRALAGLDTKGLIERHRQLDPERGWRPSYIRLRLCDQSGQEWQSRARAAMDPGVGGDTRGASSETPPRRTGRHQPGVPRATPPPEWGRVRRDTYNTQRSQHTDQQETVPPIPQQETGNDDVLPTNGDVCSDPTTLLAAATLWETIKSELAALLAPAVYEAQVVHTTVSAYHDHTLTVCCPDTRTRLWLEHRLGRMITEIASGILEQPPAFCFVAAEIKKKPLSAP